MIPYERYPRISLQVRVSGQVKLIARQLEIRVNPRKAHCITHLDRDDTHPESLPDKLGMNGPGVRTGSEILPAHIESGRVRIFQPGGDAIETNEVVTKEFREGADLSPAQVDFRGVDAQQNCPTRCEIRSS